MLTRRRFLELSAAATAASYIGASSAAAGTRPAVTATAATGARPAATAAAASPQDWLTAQRAFMIGASELTGFEHHGGQAYPPVFPWYALGTPQGAPTTTDTVITHSPIDANFIDECHAVGIRCLPYVTFSVGPPNVSIPSSDPDLAPTPQSGTYMGVEFTTPWWEQAVDGSVTTESFTVDGVNIALGQGGLPGVPVPCCNTQMYLDAMLAWVDVVMSSGADGLFLDVVQLRQACYADLQSEHAHLYTPSSSIPELNPSNPTDPFANWISQAVASGSQTLAAAQEDAGRQAAQNWAYTQLVMQVQARVRQHRSDGVVVANLGRPNYPAQWMQWFQPYFDAAFLENFVTYVKQAGGVDRLPHFGGLEAGFFNLTPSGALAATQPPGTPSAVESIPWPTAVDTILRPFVDDGGRLMTLCWVSGDTTTPQSSPTSSTYDIPGREDAFLTYAVTQVSGGIWWAGPAWAASGANPELDFGDLHEIDLGTPVGTIAEVDANGQVQQTGSGTPALTVAVFKNGVVVVNWSDQAAPATFAQLQTIVNAATSGAGSVQLPSTLWNLFDRVDVSSTASAPLVPGTTKGNPNLAGQARVYLFAQQPAYGSASLVTPELEPWPAASNATSFGPSSPALTGGPFLYDWVSNDVFGIGISTGYGAPAPAQPTPVSQPGGGDTSPSPTGGSGAGAPGAGGPGGSKGPGGSEGPGGSGQPAPETVVTAVKAEHSHGFGSGKPSVTFTIAQPAAGAPITQISVVAPNGITLSPAAHTTGVRLLGSGRRARFAAHVSHREIVLTPQAPGHSFTVTLSAPLVRESRSLHHRSRTRHPGRVAFLVTTQTTPTASQRAAVLVDL